MRKSNLTQTAATEAPASPIAFFKNEPANGNHVVTPLRKEVKDLLIAYIGDESRHIPIDLNLLVQNLYMEAQGFVDELIKGNPQANIFSVMSRDAQKWAGSTRRDPAVPLLRFPGSKHPEIGKTLHTFSTIVPFLVFTNSSPETMREELAELIAAMPDAEE